MRCFRGRRQASHPQCQKRQAETKKPRAAGAGGAEGGSHATKPVGYEVPQAWTIPPNSLGSFVGRAALLKTTRVSLRPVVVSGKVRFQAVDAEEADDRVRG